MISVLPAYSGFNQKMFDRLTIKNGLPSSHIYTVFQDKLGFIWFGTEAGLTKYDGSTYIVYEHSPNDSNSISSNSVTTISQDITGKIWVGTYGGGINIFDPETETFQLIKHNQNDKKSLSSDYISDIFIDSKNTIWIGTEDGGIETFNRGDNSFNHRHTEKGLPHNIHSSQVFTISEDQDGDIWLASYHGLYRYSYENNLFKYYSINSEFGDAENQFNAMTIDDSQNIWVGNQYGDVYMLNKSRENFKRLQIKYPTEFNWRKAGIISLLFDSKGSLWIGTWDGLIEYNLSSSEFNFFHSNSEDPYSLPDGSILGMFEDKTNLLWYATADGGVCMLNRRKNSFKHIMHGNMVNTITTDKYGNIWTGTTNGLYFYSILDNTLKAYQPIENNQNSLSSYSISSVFADNLNNIWIGTGGEGVNKWNPNSDSFLRLKLKLADGEEYNHISKIIQDKEGNIWIGTSNAGIVIIDPVNNNVLKRINSENQKELSINSLNFTDIIKDKEGNIWTGSKDGYVQKYDFSTNKFSDYSDIIEGNCINIIFLDSKNRLWIGTDIGINYYNPKTSKSLFLSKTDGIKGAIYGIEEDNDNNLWISSNKGLMKYSLKDSTVKLYDHQDGLQGNEFSPQANHKDQNGTLFFGGMNGLNIFNPQQIKTNTFAPNVVLTDFKVFGTSKILDRSYNLIDNLNLTYKDNFFSFTIAVLDYSAPEKNQIAYKLEGVDKDWVYLGKKRNIAYTNISPGRYKLMMKGCNNHGIWSTEVKTVDIYIKPPFWKTWWFIVISSGIFIASLYKAYRARIEGMKKQHKYLEEKINEGEQIVDEKIIQVNKQKEELRLRDIQEKEMRYNNRGHARFGKIIGTNLHNIETLCQAIINEIINYTDSKQGLIYILNKEDIQPTLELKAHYAASGKHLENIRVFEGEGFVGSCFKSRNVTEVKDLPEEYFNISSGLGDIKPSNLLFIPIKQKDTVIGVIEISRFEPLEEYKKNFLITLSETIFGSINTLLISNEINAALEKSKQQTELLLSQEEELRQSLEEVEATKEELAHHAENKEEILTELETQREITKLILEESSDFIFIKDSFGNYTHINSPNHPLYPEIKYIDILSNKDSAPKATQEYDEIDRIEKQVFLSGKKTKVENQHIDVNGHQYIASIALLPLKNKQKNVTGVVGFIKPQKRN